MAINDVSLTSGMRANLLSLQGTVDLLDRTQNRLSSGKKVNTAMDNPVSFFASQALNSRASVIDSLKDAMGQAVQTITSADKGITAISSMIEQAKGIAQSALSTELTQDVPEVLAQVTLTLEAAPTSGDTVIISGTTFTFTDTGAAGTFSDAVTLAAAIDAMDDFTATNNAGTITITVNRAFVDTDITGTATTTKVNVAAYSAATVEPSDEIVSLQDQYNTLRTQLSELAEDSGYKGKNLLADDDLVVKFEGTSLTVAGFSAAAADLGINAAAWTTEANINASITTLDDALVNLRSESSKLSGNLSIISVRQDFSTNMINTLTAGADKLTLADANEEGANMLMLQTRQSLSTTALSLSAQAAQSVLRLFQ
jgi:flagellin